jgi:WD40 repeat protein
VAYDLRRGLCAAAERNPSTTRVGSHKRGTTKVWDVKRGKRLTSLKGHRHSVWRLAISPDNKTILAGGVKDGARVWDVKTGEQKYAYYQDKETRVVGVTFMPDGKTFLYLAEFPGSPVQFWDMATGKEVSPSQRPKLPWLFPKGK